LSSLVLIFLINFAVALDCPDTDTIFKLSNPSNAHASIYSDTDYLTDICYSTFFGSYSGAVSTVHDCSVGPKDIILQLSGNSNAHGATSQWDTPICYGDLECIVDISQGATCTDSTRTPIVFMASSSNSHFSDSYSDIYNEKICCKATTSNSEYIWTDEAGTTISTARVGDKIRATATNYAGSPDSTFDVLEKDPFFDDSILSDVGGSISGANFIYEWLIAKADVQKSESGDYSSFFFKINGQESSPIPITFCGDGVEQAAYEDCDVPGDSCSVEYGSQNNCGFCNSNCQMEFVTGGSCGDGIVQSPNEQCDDGVNNKNTCEIGPSGTCSYCDSITCTQMTLDSSKVYWTDLSDRIITETNLGSIVKMFYPKGATKNPGKFHVFENDPILNDEIVSKIPATNQPGYFDGKINGEDYFAVWKIVQADIDAATDAGDPAFEFQFEVGQGANKKTSDNLNVLLSASQTNEKISINLTNPECGKDFMLNDEVNIAFKVIDPDDSIDITLSVDGTPIFSQTGSLGGGSYSQPYTFSTSGTKQIKVYAKSERGEEASFISNVIVIDPATSGNYVAACITNPKNFEYITTSSVHFDASSSKALKYQSGTKTFYKLEDLKFVWAFSDATSNPNTLGTNKLSYDFYKQFSTFGKNWANLDVQLVAA